MVQAKAKLFNPTASIPKQSSEKETERNDVMPSTAAGAMKFLGRSKSKDLKELQEKYDKQTEILRSSRPTISIPLDLIKDYEGVKYGSFKRYKSSEAYESLKANIKKQGLLEPIEVTPVIGKSGEIESYRIIAGHHRAQIHREIGKETIDARVLSKDEADQREEVLYQRAFFTNLHQETLCPFDVFTGLKKLMQIDKIQTKELIESTGLSKSAIYRYLNYDKLTAKTLETISKQRDLFSLNQIERIGKIIAKRESKSLLAEKLVEEMVYGSSKMTFESFVALLESEEDQESVTEKMAKVGGSKAEKQTIVIPGVVGKFGTITKKPNGSLSLAIVNEELAKTIEKAVEDFIKNHTKSSGNEEK